MTVPWLDEKDLTFPPPESALTEPDGLLAAGGDLSIDRLILAYRQGIFPWYEEGGPILWWSPEPRSVLNTRRLRISRSLRKKLTGNRFKVSCNLAFEGVIERCSAPRTYTDGTWITTHMKESYIRLHQQGVAHSLETWMEGKLVGGLYGIAIGRVFFGESMYQETSDASKVALAHLCRLLSEAGFPLIDCQVQSDHLDSMGAESMTRTDFMTHLASYTKLAVDQDLWLPRNLPPW